MAGSLKDDLKEIPSWVWLGAAAAGAVLFLLTKGRSGATSTAVPVSADPFGVSGGVPSSGASGDPWSQLMAEMQAMQTGAGAQPGPSAPPQTTPAPPSGFTSNPFFSGQPVTAGPAQGLLPTTSQPTQAGLSTAQEAIQNQLGIYGGAPVSTTRPYAGIPGWEGVTQTTYEGGGTALNLGIAQPAPAQGQVIPPAVQDQVIYQPGTNIPDWQATIAHAYQYPAGFQPGQVQH